MDFTFRPLGAWPYPSTPSYQRRSRWTFKAPWSDTLHRLRRECDMLSGREGIIAAGFRPGDIRADGLPRSDARVPSHPGVEISFYSGAQKRRLVYGTDVCEDWQHNVRSIALGLEALRAVDRYGITRRGEQYAGFAQLTAGGPDPERGKRLVDECGGLRAALLKHHPDQGGDAAKFADVMAYKKQQEGA